MAIVSSYIQERVIQADGRMSVTEKHIDQLGEEYLVTYLAESNFDFTAAMNSRALSLYAGKVYTEIASNIQQIINSGSLAVPVIRYSTVKQNVVELKAKYKTSTKTEAVMIGDFLSSLTDTQLQNMLNMTQLQVSTLRTNRLTPAATLATSIKTNVGE